MLKLETGKRYWMQYGGVTGVLRLNRDAMYPFTDGAFTWSAEGKRWTDGNEWAADLVREYTEPQPLEWKRGIPTEEECRECCLISGGFGLTPNAFDKSDLYPAAETTADEWGINEWYLPLRIKPVEPPKPKTKTKTQWQFVSSQKPEQTLWLDSGAVSLDYWKPTGATREVPCE